MPKPTRKQFPELSRYWDEYGHAVPFDDLLDFKIRRDGCYIVLLFKWPKALDSSPDILGVADVARSNHPNSWKMQNDGSDELTMDDWRRLKIVPECDWYEIPEKVV